MICGVEFVQRVKMSDVARTAGVSVATVSKVVNGRWGVSQATVDRVQQVIDQLGYEASLGAQSLRSHRTNVLGILVAEFEPFSTELLKGASRAVADTDYELLAYSGGARGADVGWERRSLSRLSGTLIDGAVIVTPTVLETKPGYPRGRRRPAYRVPRVCRPSTPTTSPAPCWRPTTCSGSATGASVFSAAARIWSRHGCARLASAGPWPTRALPSTRRSCASADTGPRPPRARPASCSTHADRPTAVFAANDLSAIATMDVARALGLAVPDDLSVIGFDNVPESALASPPLTTISQPLQRMGAEALLLLVDLIAGVERETHIRLPTELVERASCRAL